MPIAPNPDPWLPEDPVSVSRLAPTVRVYRVDAEDPSELSELPAVVCLSVEHRAGTDPWTATFRYRFDGSDEDSPQSAEQALDTNYVLSNTVQPVDRLVVKATRWDGGVECLFDGFVLEYEMDLDPRTEMVIFSAQGVAKRLWDAPIPGMLMRHCNHPDDGTDNDVQTDLVAQFNPKGKPNRTPDGAEVDIGAGRLHHTFLDPSLVQKPDIRAFWTLRDAARYLLYTLNAEEEYVKNPPLAEIELLIAREPIDGIPFDPDDDETWEPKPIRATDKPLTGRDLPTVLYDLIRAKGFEFEFALRTTGEGVAETGMRIWLLQTGTPKRLYLQPRSESLDPLFTNTRSARIKRDFGSVASVWTVRGRPVRYEASFVLAPGWPSDSGHTSAANLVRFDASAIKKTPADRDMYRLYIFDEAGEGSFKYGDVKYTPSTEGLGEKLDVLLGDGKYAHHRRKPLAELISRGPDGKPLKAVLSYCRGYAGVTPGLCDGTGTWHPISGGWEPLDDRIGIRVTAENPNQWKVGSDSDTGPPVVLRGVEDCVMLSASTPILRLTCTIEADEVVKSTVTRRSECPLVYDIERIVDASDRFRKDVVDLSSEFNEELVPIVDRDDTDAARAEATVYQLAADMGVLSGPVQIPYLTTYYRIGDRISAIVGRGIGLRTDNGGDSGLKIYPVVESIRWDLDGKQTTTIHLSDEAQQRHLIERKLSR